MTSEPDEAGPLVRAFFALELSDALRAEAADAVRALRARVGSAVRSGRARQGRGRDRDEADYGRAEKTRRSDPANLRWTRPEGWHVTLRFLGTTPLAAIAGRGEGRAACEVGCEPELVARAREALARHAPFEVALGRALAFPERRPRVLALDMTPHAPLVGLAEALERVAVACGFEPEARAFTPHLTLARMKGGGLRSGLDLAGITAAGEAAQTAREVVLFQSETLPRGAKYTPLERVSLGGVDHP